MIVRLKGMSANGRLYISGFARFKKPKEIPPYFTIEVDMEKIKPREKERCKH